MNAVESRIVGRVVQAMAADETSRADGRLKGHGEQQYEQDDAAQVHEETSISDAADSAAPEPNTHDGE